MYIRNGQVYQDDATFKTVDLDIGDRAEADIDATGLYVIPGLVDIHSHGAIGHDLCDADPAGLHEILRYEYEHGVTAYCPTSMTIEKSRLKDVFASVRGMESEPGEAVIAGLNMEGPFISPSMVGAQNQDYVKAPDIDLFRECNRLCGGIIRLVTLSPDAPCSSGFIRELHDEVHISIGHTGAEYSTALEAFEAGADHVTHLFNAMFQPEQRHPGVFGAASDSPGVTVELICDGVHIHPAMIRLAFKVFAGRIALISDSMRATGLADGDYELGGQTVHVKGKRATLTVGTIAGSVTNLFDCARFAVSIGVPVAAVVEAATATPARSIGRSDLGTLRPGSNNDILLIDKNFKLIRMIPRKAGPLTS